MRDKAIVLKGWFRILIDSLAL